MAKAVNPSQISLNNILYATDFSRYSDAALPFALSFARKYRSKIFAIHVISLSPFRLPNTAVDLSTWNHWGRPSMFEEHAPDLGPVPVTIRYVIDPEKALEFLGEIYKYQRVRHRDGATRWGSFMTQRRRTSIWKPLSWILGRSMNDNTIASRWQIMSLSSGCSVTTRTHHCEALHSCKKDEALLNGSWPVEGHWHPRDAFQG
jgi:nucleotide-binding universal stress UspA family protein